MALWCTKAHEELKVQRVCQGQHWRFKALHT